MAVMHRRRMGALLFCFAFALVPASARAQSKPFPQNGAYAHGFVPGKITAADVLSSYANWKSRYLKSDCGNGYYRVEFGSPNGSTVSEGLGYGMILTAYLGDRAAFDGLWKFALKNVYHDGLTGWKVTCSGSMNASGEGGDNTATDGDTDIGLGLVAAIDQWGDSYRPAAINYLAALKKVDFTTCEPSGRNVSKAGNWGGGCDHSNTSYFMPAFYRVFQELTGDPFWGKAADDAVALWLINRNPRTGLVGNEVDQNGATVYDQTFVNYNGCRVPWRAVLDYLWYGTPGAKDVTDKMTDWAGSMGIANLVDGYNTDGTAMKEGKYTQNNAWVGGWACGAMSKSQAAVDDFAADFKSISDDNGGYYGSSLRTLYLLMLSGNFWKPGTPSMNHAGGAASPGAPSNMDQPGVAPKLGTGTSSSCRCGYASGHAGTGGAAAFGLIVLTLRRKRRRCA
jgi:endo-1,4-beta-D-glucanase Y